jgi:signal transduction histidine kinase
MFYAVFLILVLLLNLILGLFVLSKNPRNQINISFSLFVLFVISWMGVNFLSNQFQDYSVAFFFNKLIFYVTPYIVFSLLYFSLVFPKESFAFRRERLALLLLPVIISNLLTFFNLVITGVTFLPEGGTGVVFGPGVIFYGIQFVLYIILSISVLVINYRRLSGFQKVQLKYVLLGVAILTITATLTNFIIPLITGNFWASNLGPLLSISVFGFTAYAIVRHRLMDISLVVARTVSYSVLVTIFGLAYALLFGVLSSVFVSAAFETRTVAVSTILALFMAFSFQTVRRQIERITDRLLYRDHYDTNHLLYALTVIMASTLRLEDLTHLLLQHILREMRLSKGAFILMENDKIYEIAAEGFKVALELDENRIHELALEPKPVVFDELSEGFLKELLRGLDVNISVRLETEGKITGLFVLGGKLSGDIYSQEDIRVLEIFVPGAAVAIQNAKAYEEIRRFSITLQEEVDRATKDLQVANEKLKDLDKLKDEFVSVASHELRTPMTSIKSYLWMALDGRGGAITEKQKYYLDRAYDSTDRLIKLVNDMLNVSRIESGRINIQAQSTDIAKLIDDVVGEIKPRADELGLSLIYEPSAKLPEVLADPDKIKEVIINLIGNSLKFTPSGGKIRIWSEKQGELVVTSVVDNGEGIEKADQERLFQKFGLIGSSYVTNKASTQGTGLGLYICRSIIELLKGRIWVESAGKGKGATFRFSLRIFNQTDYDELQKSQDGKAPIGLIHTEI